MWCPYSRAWTRLPEVDAATSWEGHDRQEDRFREADSEVPNPRRARSADNPAHRRRDSAPAHDRRHGDRSHVKPTFLDRIDLPNGFQPEGIASGKGTTFYVGSIPTGAVNVGDFTTNGTKPLVLPQTGRAAIGLKFHKGRLFVAGGGTGKAFVYDAATGADLKTFELATGDAPTFLNDVVVARGTAWFTDSRRPVLYAVDTKLGSARTLQLPGFTPAAGFNLNGIVAVKDRWLALARW